jgi:hypothetical protein
MNIKTTTQIEEELPEVLEVRQIRKKLQRESGYSWERRVEQARAFAVANGFTLTRLKPAVPCFPDRVSSAAAAEPVGGGVRL